MTDDADPSDGPPPSEQSEAELREQFDDLSTSQPSDPSDRMEAGDATKFEVRGHSISINEWHAFVLGKLLGAGIGVAYHVGGYEQWALGAAALLGGYAVLGKAMLQRVPHVDERASKTMVLRTIRREPWYYLAAFVPTVGVVLGVVPGV